MARGNWHHRQMECPICGQICDRSGAMTAHMRKHVREGKATERMEKDILGNWERVFTPAPRGTIKRKPPKVPPYTPSED